MEGTSPAAASSHTPRKSRAAAVSRDVAVAALAGIIGTVVGAMTTTLITAHTQEMQRRAQLVADSFKVETGQVPREFWAVKFVIDEARNLTIMSGSTIHHVAEIRRRYQDCSDTLSERCEQMMVELIGALRHEYGSDLASAEDIEIILRDKYRNATKAIERGSR